MMQPCAPLVALVVLVTAAQAQSEAALKDYFEGKTVTVKLAMPGTEDGVDIYPLDSRPLDYTRYADRLKDYGTAIKAGEAVMVTKVKVKSKLIEFQLGGGGYGTMGDETSSNVSTSATPKTKREQNLEAELKRETDPAKKRAMKEELDDLRKDREREDARNRAAVAEAQEHKKENIRQRRLEGGSRFNIRYRDGVPSTSLTPLAIKRALRGYLVFDAEADSSLAAKPAGMPLADPPASPMPAHRLYKGMLLEQADAALGPAQKSTERMEGRLKVVTRTYPSEDGVMTAEFVEGVLFRYSLKSN
ncbi:MAG TPA: hypothetical protein VH763_19910 [Gemmatimonadales bacterium]|jgi:hypothetical protein